MKKFILMGSLVLLVLLGIGTGVVFSGVLVLPTPDSLAKDTPVKSYDLLAFQSQREKDLLAEYARGSYSLQKPYLALDPYRANPLSALVLFESPEPAQVTLTVAGKDASTTYSYRYSDLSTHHELAVLGLYPGQDNRVSLSLSYANGKKESADVQLQTAALPPDFPRLEVQVSKPAGMEPGVDLVTACLDSNYSYLLDAHGEVRGYFSNKNFGHCNAMRVLKNGRLLTSGDVLKLMPYNMSTLWEMNLLGKVFIEYGIPNGVHHDIVELANGDFLAASNNLNMPLNYDTREDVIIRIDRQTGAVKQEIDLRKILDERRKTYQHYDAGVLNSTNRDWFHLNAVAMDESSGSILASSPMQSAVVKFNAASLKIDWILSANQGWDGEFSRYQAYLLKPVGTNFEWQWGQHAAKFLPDSDGDPNTTDILLFDNGQSRNVTQQGSLNPANNYSRAVIYRINESQKTVEQLWQYGKERGSAAYATFLGDANLLKTTGNVLIDFGGMLRKDGVPVDDIVAGVLSRQPIQSRVVEVRRSGEVVFDVLITPNQGSDASAYRVTKINLPDLAGSYALGQSPGQRKGATQSNVQVNYELPPYFVSNLSFDFKQIYQQNGRLILQGSFQFQGQTYLLGKLVFVLKSSQREYFFSSNPGINSNFAAQIDLTQVQPGEYALYAAGGVVDGLDAQGKLKPGYNPTGYKIQVP